MTHSDFAAYVAASGLTQQQIARALGISQSVVSLLKNRKLVPPLHVALRLSKATGVPVEAFATRRPS